MAAQAIIRTRTKHQLYVAMLIHDVQYCNRANYNGTFHLARPFFAHNLPIWK